METQTVSKPVTDEQKLIEIIRRLPPERVFQVIDFAQFLEFQTTRTDEGVLDEELNEVFQHHKSGVFRSIAQARDAFVVRLLRSTSDVPTSLLFSPKPSP